MKRMLLAIGLMWLLVAAVAIAEEQASQSANPAEAAALEHRAYAPGDIKWGDAPPSLPRGAKLAVVSGDPHAAGVFTMRLSVPAGYRIPPHFHPGNEHVTVISGQLNMALGEKWDETKGHAIPAGGFAIMPKGVRHFAWAKTPTVVQIHGYGPWGITYVNPADDPRNDKTATTQTK